MTAEKNDKTYVLAIDQGTTSSRAILFDRAGGLVAVDQKEHAQILPRAGWVEHDATEIWSNVRAVVAGVLSAAEVNRHEIAAVGITNQRESAVVWDRATGEPVHNVIVWQDTRTRRICDRLAAAAPDAASTPGAGRLPRLRPLQGPGGPGAGHLLRRPQGGLDPGERGGRPRACRGR